MTESLTSVQHQQMVTS